jgi:hypothetical protein
MPLVPPESHIDELLFKGLPIGPCLKAICSFIPSIAEPDENNDNYQEFLATFDNITNNESNSTFNNNYITQLVELEKSIKFNRMGLLNVPANPNITSVIGAPLTIEPPIVRNIPPGPGNTCPKGFYLYLQRDGSYTCKNLSSGGACKGGGVVAPIKIPEIDILGLFNGNTADLTLLMMIVIKVLQYLLKCATDHTHKIIVTETTYTLVGEP